MFASKAPLPRALYPRHFQLCFLNYLHPNGPVRALPLCLLNHFPNAFTRASSNLVYRITFSTALTYQLYYVENTQTLRTATTPS